MQIGEFAYPSQTTFAETLAVASEAYEKYRGLMPAMKVAEKLGYRIKNPAAISGFIYRKFDEMALFGLFVRERGGIRITDLGKAALNPFDQEETSRARVNAIRNIPIIAKAFTEWKGKLPDEEAFPSLVKDLTGVDWKTAKDVAGHLWKLFSECFPILSGSTVPLAGSSEQRHNGKNGTTLIAERFDDHIINQSGIYGELRTMVGSIIIRNSATIKLAHSLLEVLEAEIPTPSCEQSEKSQVVESSEKNSAMTEAAR